jgi:NADH-quinone oxidoreductase subunit I
MIRVIQHIKKYFSDIFGGLITLLKGMKVTGYYFTHARTEILTQQYPENRDELQMFERFRGEVIMPHNEDNEHRCTGCQACEIACPNGSIEIVWDRKVNPETGKKKKEIDTFVYHLSLCTMCNLCIPACPTDAIIMGQDFEHAVYDRSDLTKVLNKPGSKLAPGVEE